MKWWDGDGWETYHLLISRLDIDRLIDASFEGSRQAYLRAL